MQQLLSLSIILLAWVCCVSISAKAPPRVIAGLHPAEQSAKVGESLRLACPVEADPKAIVEWEKDGEVIHMGWERFTKRNNDYVLMVKNLEKSDSGTYRCKAVNGFGSVQFQYIITVYSISPSEVDGLVASSGELDNSPMSAPWFPASRQKQMLSQQSQNPPVGASIRLRCRADGRPRPLVYWYKDGILIPQQPQQQQQSGSLASDSAAGQQPEDEETSTGFVLRLNIQSAEQSGRYTCRASNNMGTVNFTYSVTVIENQSELPEFIPPYLSNVTVTYLETAVFHCQVRSALEPIVQWLKRVDSQQVNGTIRFDNERYLVLSGRQNGVLIPRNDDIYLSRLALYNVTEKHAGLYICSATNTRGYSYRGAYLNVLTTNNGGGRGGNGFIDPTPIGDPPQAPSIVVVVAIATVFFAVFIAFAVIFARRRHRQHINAVVSKYGGGPGMQCKQRPNVGKVPATPLVTSSSGGVGDQLSGVALLQQRYHSSQGGIYNGLLYHQGCEVGGANDGCGGSGKMVYLQMNNECFSRADCT